MPQNKPTGPTTLGCICDENFSFYSPSNLRKFCTKGSSYCAPSEVCATKGSNKTNATCLHLQLRPFFGLHPQTLQTGARMAPRGGVLGLLPQNPCLSVVNFLFQVNFLAQVGAGGASWRGWQTL